MGHCEQGLAGLQKQRVAELVGEIYRLQFSSHPASEVKEEVADMPTTIPLLPFMKVTDTVPRDSTG